MNQTEFNQIITDAQNSEYNRLRELDIPAFYTALQQFAVASGFGQHWETDIDGIRYSISKIDGTFKADKAKFTTQVKSVGKPTAGRSRPNLLFGRNLIIAKRS